ncbi:MAG: hypothetical protein JSV32_00745, partial [Dehalococcoidia bacterium]
LHCSLWPGFVATRAESDFGTRAVCFEAHAFGIMSATYFEEKDLPRKFYQNSAFNTPGAICGGSGIIDPSGQYITGPVYDQETIVYGEIDLSEIDRVRMAVNLTGSYSRWDLLSLNVRQEEYEPLMPMNTAEGELHDISGLIAGLELRINHLEQQIASISLEKRKSIHKKE